MANAYNGLGQRVSQTVDSVVTEYLLDVQPGLWVTLAEARDGDVTRFVHGPRGMQAQQQPDGTWLFPVQDALGSVRAIFTQELNALGKQHFAPYGVPFGLEGVLDTSYGFTGEQASGSELLYLRARHYAPALGAFARFDPLEVTNRYAYVNGNPVNLVDLSGRAASHANLFPLSPECGDLQWLREDRGRFSPLDGEPRDGICDQYCGFDWYRYMQCIEASPDNPRNWIGARPEPFYSAAQRAYYRSANQHWDWCESQSQYSYLGFVFPEHEYPSSCAHFSDPEDCAIYHLNFLVNTDTIRDLRSRYHTWINLFDLQLFASFVAPDNFHTSPGGSPGDVKTFYERYLPQGVATGGNQDCITIFGRQHGYDIIGNIAYGYIGTHANFTYDTLQFWAGVGQILSNIKNFGLGEAFRSGDLQSYGDDPIDQVAVLMGVALYHRCGTSCAIDSLEQLFEDFDGQIAEATRTSPHPACAL